MMKKQNFYALLVIAIMITTAIVSLFYLTAEIAIQWNENGVSSTASKSLVFAFPALSVIFYLLHKTNNKDESVRNDFVSLLIPVFLLSTQLLITLNALGYINMICINYQLIQTLALLIVGLLMTVCGNSLPKFAKNYYNGVKSSWAYESDNLWTKTQRFAGKIWFFSGLVIMILSIIRWEGISIITLCIILNVIFVPRVYSKFLYDRVKANKN